MAIYHLKVQVLSRSTGKTAVAAAAYRSASLLRDECQGLVFDYSKKQGVEYSKILTPENAPVWTKNREKLWNAVEAAEIRINSQVAREIEIAIPVELKKAQGVNLVEEFVKREFVSLGMIADVNIHLDNPENPHAHILLTTREISQDGFTVKNRSWNDREKLHEWRRSWAEIANEHLLAAGYEISIDHRSYQEQGIDLTPSVHLGPLLHGILQKAEAEQAEQTEKPWQEKQTKQAEQIKRGGRAERAEQSKISIEIDPKYGSGIDGVINDGGGFKRRYERLEQYHEIAAKNGAKIIKNPEIALDILTAQQSVFSENDIYKFANRNSVDRDQFEKVVWAIKNHGNAIKLAKTEQGSFIYTSREMVELEAGLIQTAIGLSEIDRHPVAEKYREQAFFDSSFDSSNVSGETSGNTSGVWIQKAFSKLSSKLSSDVKKPNLKKPSLNEGQLKSLANILDRGDLKIVIGHAGTGKSTILSVARDAWEAQGYRVIGTALSGIAAQKVQESGIQSRTIDSLLYALEKNTFNLNSRDVVVIDEAGMINTRKLAELLYAVKNAEAKVVMLGDPEQLQPISAGAPFRAIIERIGYTELSENVRQRDPLMQLASQEFATKRTYQALGRYMRLGKIYEHKTRFDAIDAVIDSWSKGSNRSNSIILAYTRKDVATLNQKAREILKNENILKAERMLNVTNRNGEVLSKSFAVNDKIYFVRNDNFFGVKNGSLGIIRSIEGDLLTVLLDTDKTIVFSLDDYSSIDHGYAATVHKAQGITVDKTYFLADKYLDRHATYVAATRHRDHLEIHYDCETFKYAQEFYHTLSRENAKDMVVDYADVRDLQSLLEANESERESDFIKLDKTLEKMLISYLDKQIELDRLKQLKIKAGSDELAHDYGKQVLALNKQLAKDAKFIIDHPQAKILTKQAQIKDQASFYERGGVQKVKERMKSNQLVAQDFVAIAREVYFKSTSLVMRRERSLEVEQGREI